ncbi:MAG: sporulation protein YabP [Butyricicoccus sp.]
MSREPQNKKEVQLPHGLTLQDRSRMTLSGVKDVVTFDETQVILHTEQGTLTIRGTRMHVDQLNLDSGDLSLTGTIDSLEYDNDVRGGLLGRLFR